MSMRIGNHVRQWVALPGGSCDMRVGTGSVDEMGSILKSAVGKPHAALLVVEETTPDELAERVRRQLTDAGFAVVLMTSEAGPVARTLEATGALAARFAEAAITSDDLVVAVGGADSLSAAASVAGAWYGGTALAVVPTTLVAALEAVATPRAISVDAAPEALSVRARARHAVVDMAVVAPERARITDWDLVGSLMVAGAVCDSEKAVEALWDRAGEVAACELEALGAQVADSAKSRGKVAASSSVAVRSSCGYGMTFARALMAVAPNVDAGVALGEGLRFCGRLSAGMGLLSVDDVLTQDELLDTLGVGLAQVSVSPHALVAAIRAERFRRTNRLMLELPRALGRVRLSSVGEDLLQEHVEAWCAARATR